MVDAGDPVAQRLVDGVLERGAAGVDRDHLGAEQLHPRDVEGLALDVDRAHVDGAVQPEVRRGGRAGDAVLAGAGLGDHAGLAHPPGEQGLAEHVADLVGAGVVEVLALEQDPAAGLLGEPRRLVERARQCRRTRGRSWRAPRVNAGSAIASCHAAASSSRAATRASGMKRPPNARRTSRASSASQRLRRRAAGLRGLELVASPPLVHRAVSPVSARTAPSGSSSLTSASPTRTASAPSAT